MKGVELPINVMIIVVIAVVVLLVSLALFTDVFDSGGDTVSLETARVSACQKLVTTGCSSTDLITVSNFDVDENGSKGDAGDTLTLLCTKHYGIDLGANPDGCKNLCNC